MYEFEESTADTVVLFCRVEHSALGELAPLAVHVCTACASSDAHPRMRFVEDWPAPYMAPALAAYLRHHRSLLLDVDLWEPHAAQFAERL